MQQAHTVSLCTVYNRAISKSRALLLTLFEYGQVPFDVSVLVYVVSSGECCLRPKGRSPGKCTYQSNNLLCISVWAPATIVRSNWMKSKAGLQCRQKEQAERMGRCKSCGECREQNKEKQWSVVVRICCENITNAHCIASYVFCQMMSFTERNSFWSCFVYTKPHSP